MIQTDQYYGDGIPNTHAATSGNGYGDSIIGCGNGEGDQDEIELDQEDWEDPGDGIAYVHISNLEVYINNAAVNTYGTV